MRRIENLLLSKMPVWIVVVLLALGAAGTVVFGALVEYTATRKARNFDVNHFLGLGHVALGIARIPENLHRLSFGPHPAEARRQRFDGQAGLAFADTAHFSEGYLFLARHLPKSTFDEPEGWVTLHELIDLSRRETVHVWQLPPLPAGRDTPVYPLPDGSLIVPARRSVMRVDACSNVERRKELESMAHHSIERDADGNFWMPARVWAATQADRPPALFDEDELLKLSPAGDVLARISLTDALVRNGYRHLLYGLRRSYEFDPLHVNDVEPVLRDGPFWRRGDLFVSLRNSSVVLLYRPATGEVVWLRQGPWLHQHDVDVVSDSEISVFSNNAVRIRDGERLVLGANEVYVHDFATGEARSPWREAMRRHDVRTEYLLLVGDRLHHLRAGHVHVGAVLHHEDEVGHRRGVDRAARARPHDQRDLGNDPRGEHVALEHLRVPAQRGHPLLDPRPARVVQADDRGAHLHRVVHDLADLLGVRLRQRAAEHREVLAEHEHQPAVDGAVAGDHAVTGHPAFGHAEVGAAVLDEHVPFLERAGVEQHFEALARGQAPLRVLCLDARRPAPLPGRLALRLEGSNDLLHGWRLLRQ